MKTLAINRQAKRNYEVLETFEAGLVLQGAEVKAARTGQINLKGAYVAINEKQELCLINAHISLYKKSSLPDYNPKRARKLLLHRKEINSLIGKLKQKGLTLVPLKVYTRGKRLKLEFGLAKGKKKWDKREAIKEKESRRRMERALKTRG